MMISSGQWRLNNYLTNHSGVNVNGKSAVLGNASVENRRKQIVAGAKRIKNRRSRPVKAGFEFFFNILIPEWYQRLPSNCRKIKMPFSASPECTSFISSHVGIITKPPPSKMTGMLQNGYLTSNAIYGVGHLWRC